MPLFSLKKLLQTKITRFKWKLFLQKVFCCLLLFVLWAQLNARF